MARRLQARGRTRWYYRVREPGRIRAGATMRILARPFPAWPLARLLEMLYQRMLDHQLRARPPPCRCPNRGRGSHPQPPAHGPRGGLGRAPGGARAGTNRHAERDAPAGVCAPRTTSGPTAARPSPQLHAR